jgi:hypothetical protein
MLTDQRKFLLVANLIQKDLSLKGKHGPPSKKEPVHIKYGTQSHYGESKRNGDHFGVKGMGPQIHLYKDRMYVGDKLRGTTTKLTPEQQGVMAKLFAMRKSGNNMEKQAAVRLLGNAVARFVQSRTTPDTAKKKAAQKRRRKTKAEALTKTSKNKEKKAKPTAVIVKGNPDHRTEGGQGKKKARRFYSHIATVLKDEGYKVSFDKGLPYTQPKKADLWLGHSRGVDRLRFAPKETLTIATGSRVAGAINHPLDKKWMSKKEEAFRAGQTWKSIPAKERPPVPNEHLILNSDMEKELRTRVREHKRRLSGGREVNVKGHERAAIKSDRNLRKWLHKVKGEAKKKGFKGLALVVDDPRVSDGGGSISFSADLKGGAAAARSALVSWEKKQGLNPNHDRSKEKTAEFVFLGEENELVFADEEDRHQYAQTYLLGGLVKYASPAPSTETKVKGHIRSVAGKEIYVFPHVRGLPSKMEKAIADNGSLAFSMHKRIAIPKSNVSYSKLRRVGFKPTLFAIAEPGQKKMVSFRGPHGLHAHDHGTHWVMHKDSHAPKSFAAALAHWKTEGKPSADLLHKWRSERKGPILPKILKTSEVLFVKETS